MRILGVIVFGIGFFMILFGAACADSADIAIPAALVVGGMPILGIGGLLLRSSR